MRLAIELDTAQAKIRTGTYARIAKLHALALREPTLDNLRASIAFVDVMCYKTFRREFGSVVGVSVDTELTAASLLEPIVITTLALLYAYVDSLTGAPTAAERSKPDPLP
jgi:hypothetical protein